MATEVKVNKFALTILIALGVMVSIYIISKTKRNYAEQNIKLSQLISASINLVERAGRRVAEVREMDNSEIGQISKGLTKEGKNEYVTAGDKESHQIIVSGLRSLWPSLPLQSEENDIPLIGGARISLSNSEVMSMAVRDEAVPVDKITVWIDPLDATHEYTEGKANKSLLRFVTVMICIAVNGKPVAGIINEPFSFQGVTKWAWVGHGISDSLVAARVNKDSNSNKLKLIYSRSHAGKVSEVAKRAFKPSRIAIDEVVAAGSGYKTLQVVERKADLYLHVTNIKKWDICAGNAILNAVGGKMTTLKGKEIDYSFKDSPRNEDGLVAALPEYIQQQYVSILQGNAKHYS